MKATTTIPSPAPLLEKQHVHPHHKPYPHYHQSANDGKSNSNADLVKVLIAVSTYPSVFCGKWFTHIWTQPSLWKLLKCTSALHTCSVFQMRTEDDGNLVPVQNFPTNCWLMNSAASFSFSCHSRAFFFPPTNALNTVFPVKTYTWTSLSNHDCGQGVA